MKYEILRKQRLLYISLVIVAVIEAGIVYTLYRGGNSLAIFSILVFLLGFGGLVFILIDNIIMYSSDLTKKQGYMIFLAPRNGYQILGAKVVIGFIELIAGFLLYFILMFLNSSLFYHLHVEEKTGLLSLFLENFGDILPNSYEAFMILLALILIWFSYILTMYLAITLRKTVLSNVKFSGIISFVFFIVLVILISFIKTKIYELFGFPAFGIDFNYDKLIKGQLTASYIIDSIFILIMFFTSGYLLNKRVDL